VNSATATVVEPTVLKREYRAPRQLVFEAWTKPEHIQDWQFPFPGFKCEFARADIRPGGETLHKMAAPNGFEMWLLTRYEEINPYERLVFRQYNSNENGDILPNPQMPGWPKEMRTTILLEETGDTTKLQLIWQPVDPSEEEAQIFETSRPDHDKGWGGGLEQLVSYLDSLQ
jgi:uncharacterized protein YndB with AHSA1/START domain